MAFLLNLGQLCFSVSHSLLSGFSVKSVCFLSLVSSQDENDNPPEFSKPAYIVNILENIVAGVSNLFRITAMVA